MFMKRAQFLSKPEAQQTTPTQAQQTVQHRPSPQLLVQRAQANPQSLTPRDVLQLQRTYGNRFVQHLLLQNPSQPVQKGSLQAKLTVTPAGDQYEAEADAMSKQVMQTMRVQRQPEDDELQLQRQPEDDELQLQRQPEDDELQLQRQPEDDELQLQRQPEDDELQLQRQPEDDELQLQRSPDFTQGGEVGGSIESQIRNARGGGQPLPENVRAPMENAFGTDFSGVRVHTDSSANTLNRSVQAKAFTTGSDLFFSSGTYQPHSQSGQELLAHELTHVVQQGGAKNVQRKKTDATEMIQRVVVAAVTFGPVNALNPANTPVQTVTFAGRANIPFPEGPGGGQGAHLVANIVFEQTVKRAVEGVTFIQAITNLREEFHVLSDLPGFNMGHVGVPAARAVTQTNLLNQLDNIINGVTVVPDVHKSQVLAHYCRSYMELRSALHLVASTNNQDAGAPHQPTPANNQTGSNNLVAFNSANDPLTGGELNTVATNIWHTFEYRPTQANLKTAQAATRVIATLLMSTFRAYPQLRQWEDAIINRIVQDFINREGVYWGWVNADNIAFENQTKSYLETKGYNAF
jgi:hypothetical protein